MHLVNNNSVVLEEFKWDSPVGFLKLLLSQCLDALIVKRSVKGSMVSAFLIVWVIRTPVWVVLVQIDLASILRETRKIFHFVTKPSLLQEILEVAARLQNVNIDNDDVSIEHLLIFSNEAKS